MSVKLSEQEQLAIIKEVEEKYSKFLDSNFDANVFLECRDNFTLTAHIESVKIFEMENTPTNPTFTIAIPTYNRYETLKKAIDSVLSQKSDENFEIIVVENVDDFDTKTLAQQMLEEQYRGKLTYFKNKKNIGLYENWNRCLILSKGKWVCLLHSDDYMLPGYLDSMKWAIQSKPHAILIGNLQFFDTKFLSKIFSKCMMLDNLMFALPIKRPTPSTLLHHKERCIQIGGYNGLEFPSADVFFSYRCAMRFPLYTFRKKLHEKTREIATESQPITRLQFCILDSIFFSKCIKPSFFGRFFAYQHLRNHQINFEKDNLPLLANKTSQIIDKLKLKNKWFFFSKTIKIIYLVLRSIHLVK